MEEIWSNSYIGMILILLKQAKNETQEKRGGQYLWAAFICITILNLVRKIPFIWSHFN